MFPNKHLQYSRLIKWTKLLNSLMFGNNFDNRIFICSYIVCWFYVSIMLLFIVNKYVSIMFHKQYLQSHYLWGLNACLYNNNNINFKTDGIARYLQISIKIYETEYMNTDRNQPIHQRTSPQSKWYKYNNKYILNI